MVQVGTAADAPASSPTTYADVAGFRTRATTAVTGLATNDLGQWRRGGYFGPDGKGGFGGDAAKYLLGPAMARLVMDPKDAMAREYMNDVKSYTEHYHFGAVNWARYYPLFSDTLTPDIKTKFAAFGGKYGAYLNPAGTENHKVMWTTSSNVLPLYVEGDRFGQRSKADALKTAKEQLRKYVKGLYAAGQGEWDSSTYIMFDVNGMLNIYDFSTDPETRLLAKAALDWLATGYALKYRDGVYTAPNQRGFAPGPVKKIADQTGWLWWGSNKEITPEDARGFLYTMHPITSGWRPNQVISNIATQNLPVLPYESHDTKPNYWHGMSLTPTPGSYQETVYVAKEYTIGSLWKGWGGQMARFELVANGPHGGIAFTGGHPTGLKYEDGNGKYDENALADGTAICMSKIPEADPQAYVFFSLPEGVAKPVAQGKWQVMQAGNTFLALYPLGTEMKVGESDLSAADKTAYDAAIAAGTVPKTKPFPLLRFEGRNTGFLLETADTTSYKDIDAFSAALRDPKVATAAEVTYTNLRGTTIQAKYTGTGRAETSINDKPLDTTTWAIYDNPYIYHKDGILTVNDGKAGFIVDFIGDLPVYKTWTKAVAAK